MRNPVVLIIYRRILQEKHRAIENHIFEHPDYFRSECSETIKISQIYSARY